MLNKRENHFSHGSKYTETGWVLGKYLKILSINVV